MNDKERKREIDRDLNVHFIRQSPKRIDTQIGPKTYFRNSLGNGPGNLPVRAIWESSGKTFVHWANPIESKWKEENCLALRSTQSELFLFYYD